MAAATKLGNFLTYVLRHDNETVKVHLATATYFRGDQQTILSHRFKTDFMHYYLPWDEHFPTLGIEHLQTDFLTYQDDPIDAVVALVKKETDERHLIIIPALTHRWRTSASLNQLMAGLYEVFPASQVLDLVTPSTQHAHKELLHTHPEEFRVVVACRLFDEGTDWVPCSWMHNTDACEQSVTLAVQRFFRPLRQHPDKKVVQIFNYLPGFTTEMTMNEKRQVFSNRFAAFLSCIVTHGEIVPVMVNTKPKTNQGASKKLSLQEVFGDKFPNVMSDMLERYELVEDKEDAAAIEEIADQILFDYDLPDGVDVGNLRDALLTQLCRIAVPNKNLTPSNIEPNGIDANSIRELGFDKVWEKVALVPSVVCFGTDNIDVAMIRELLGIVKETPSLEEIHEGIRVFKQRTGKPPTFHQSEWMIELNRTASAVDKVLRRHYDSTLAREVRTVFGDFNDDLLVKTHDLIREYWSRGIRIGNKYGNLPGIGMSSYALNGRLKNHYNTTLAAEVRTILGPQVKPLSISKVIDVIQQYADQGIHLHRKFGSIPELDMSSYNLADRLKRNSIVTLSELVQSVEDNM